MPIRIGPPVCQLTLGRMSEEDRCDHVEIPCHGVRLEELGKLDECEANTAEW